MNINGLKDAIKHGYKIGRPVCSLSSPGIGKSNAVFQCCEELSQQYKTEFGMIEVRGASSSPAELAAIKYVDEGHVLEAEQAWFPTDEKVAKGLCQERGLIFCDEISSSLPAVVSTLQRMFLDHKLGGLSLAKGWDVTAAGNRAKDKSAATNLSRAFVNRCMMVTVEPDADILYNWGSENGFDFRVLSFLRFRPDCVADGLTIKSNIENPAFCSPRSLHIVSDILKDLPSDFNQSVLYELITGTLGDGRGSEFNGFLRIHDSLPNLDQILKDPLNYPVPKAVDVAWATIGALIQRLTKKNVKLLTQFFTRFPTELSVVAVKDLAKKDPAVYMTDEFKHWATDNVKFCM